MPGPKGPGRGGFSLAELVIAMALSSFVMIGIVGISAQMVRYQVEGMKKGSVTGWSLVSISRMNKEIEDATVLVYPTNGSGARDNLIGCKNWSRYANGGAGGRLDASGAPAGNVVLFYYCYDTTNRYIRRYANVGTAVACPAGVPAIPACDGSGGWTENDVVATGVYRDTSNNFLFRRADEVGGIQIRYVIGNPTPTTNMPQPQTMAFDTRLAMNKQYNNTLD